MNKVAGRVLTVLAAIQMGLALLLVVVANFADGGTWWERGFLSILHPLAVALLLAVLLIGYHGPSLLSRTAIGVLGVHVAGAVGISIAILTGLSKGDWFLGLALAVIPAVGLAFLLTTRAPEAATSG